MYIYIYVYLYIIYVYIYIYIYMNIHTYILGSLLSRFTDMTKSATFLSRKEPIKEENSPELPIRNRALSRDDENKDRVRILDVFLYVHIFMYQRLQYDI
jgi:hypothetical protein